MAQTIRRNAKPARRQARAQNTRTKVRQAKRKTNSLIDALMRVLPFTEEQLQKTFLIVILAATAALATNQAAAATPARISTRKALCSCSSVNGSTRISASISELVFAFALRTLVLVPCERAWRRTGAALRRIVCAISRPLRLKGRTCRSGPARPR